MRTAALLLVLLVAAPLTGCIGGGATDEPEPVDLLAEPPQWQVGDWWLYTFSTPEWDDDSARLVVTEVDAETDTLFMLGISSRREARRHAVLNHNPFLGRITHNMSVFENGEASPVLPFPLRTGGEWQFDLFDKEWNATVISAAGGIATIRAEHYLGETLQYTYDGVFGFIGSLRWATADDDELLGIRLVESGVGHTGEVWFIRAGDLYSGDWEHASALPDVEVRDTFLVSGHPQNGDWDEMIYWLDARMGGGVSTSTLTLRDHLSLTALARTWGPGAEEEGQLGTIPYPSGEYTFTLTQTGESHVRMIIAGGISTSWTL